MDEDECWSAVSFVKRSEQRKAVLEEAESPSMPKEIADEADMHQSHVSRALKQLREEDLVKCMNPDDTRGRLYRATDKGETVLDKIE